MSILDTVSSLFSGNPQVKGFVEGMGTFLTQNGGLDGLKSKLEKEGAGNLLKSWIATGPNLPISPEQVQKVLGTEFVQNIASKMGVDPATASHKISEMMPTLIDKLSPNGQMPTSLDAKSLMGVASQLFSTTATKQ